MRECRHKDKGEGLPTIAELEAQLAAAKATAASTPGLKLDLGCGTKKQPGFIGVDSRAFPAWTWCAISAAMSGRGRTARSTK
jgi:hypothetical protein